MSDVMRCLQVTEWGEIPELAEVPIPSPTETDVLLEIEATSVGLTVHNVINGQLGSNEDNLPRIPGHELVGRVVERGDGVDQLSEGDLVAGYFYLTCDACDYCRRGHDSLCENLAGFLGVDTDGGYTEYTSIPAANAIKLPDGIDPVEATVVPDALGTPYHVVNQRANVEPGDRVMVLGAGGGVGIHLVQIAQYFGGKVTAVDLVDEKLETCADLGAIETVNPSEESLVDHAEETGLTYDSIVDFTGSVDLLEEATGLLGPRGRLVNMTAFQGRTMDLSPRDQVMTEMEVVGSKYCSKYEMARSGELVADGIIEPVISEVVGLDEVTDLLSRIADGGVLGRGAMTPS